MSIRSLRALLAVHDHGTFSAAAEAICVSHAAVSQQMKGLEAHYGVALFDRSSRPPQLTPAGLALVAKGRAVVEAYDALPPAIRGGDALRGELRLGAVPSTVAGLLSQGLSMLKGRFPQLHVRLSTGLTTALLNDIKRGTVEAAVVSRPEPLPPGLRAQDIACEPLQLLVSPQIEDSDAHKLLREQPFIRFNRDAVVGHLIERYLQAQRINVIESMELSGLESIASMVMANLGVAICPRHCIAGGSALALRRLSLGAAAPQRWVSLVSREDSARRPVFDVVHRSLCDAVAAAGAVPAPSGGAR